MKRLFSTGDFSRMELLVAFVVLLVVAFVYMTLAKSPRDAGAAFYMATAAPPVFTSRAPSAPLDTSYHDRQGSTVATFGAGGLSASVEPISGYAAGSHSGTLNSFTLAMIGASGTPERRNWRSSSLTV